VGKIFQGLFFAAIFISASAFVAAQTDASITTRTNQARPSQTPVPRATPVRPLSEEDRRRQEAASERRRQEAASGDPDVLLDVPNLSVEEITLEVENLRAKVSLDARLANLLQLTAGADAGIDKVKLTIKGVKAEVLLKVRLDNVAAIIDRTLTTIDRNPEILVKLLESVDKTVGTVGNVANTALQPGGVVDNTLRNVTAPNGLLSQTVNTLGQTVQRTLDTTGNVVGSRTVGNLTDLRVLSETKNSAGQIVRRLQDTGGGVIEAVLDSAGKIVSSRVIQQATRPNQ
jgi:hypothetical protein